MAQKYLKVWESPHDLQDYAGRKVPVFTIGTRDQTSNNSTFFLEFNLNYVRNQGAAWGFLGDLQDSIRVPLFHFITLLAVIVIFLYFQSTPLHHRLARLALVLILSGACGNFTDRIRLGYVIDFLDFRWNIPLIFPINISIDFWPSTLDFLNFDLHLTAWRYNFPNFNWADSMITTGVFLLLFDMLVLEPFRNKAAKG